MDGYSIKKDGQYLTSLGAIQTGKYSFTDNAELRSIFDNEDTAINICKLFENCEVINEYNQLVVYPETTDLCGFCCCSLAYGYIEYREVKFCSQSCIDEATEGRDL